MYTFSASHCSCEKRIHDRTQRDRQQVECIARNLLETLKREKLILDWKKRQAARAAVNVAIEQVLDKEIPSGLHLRSLRTKM